MLFTLTLNPALDYELNVPALEFNTVLRATAGRTDWGGKGFNVSRALAALGAESVALGFVGGQTGRRLEAGLHAAGIETDFVWVEGETRTNVSIVAPPQYIKANEAGPYISPTELYTLHQKIERLAGRGDWWVLSGSLPPGVPPKFYHEVIEVVQRAGGRAVLDASGPALFMGCKAGPHLVKPNRSEAAALAGVPVQSVEDARAAAEAIRTLGPQLTALSLGAEGALLFNQKATWVAAPPPVEEQNPTGAGDAMVAGLVWAMAEGHGPDEALAWGVACGAAAASLPGTAMGPRAMVAELREAVRVEGL